jgi:hypothetical protein
MTTSFKKLIVDIPKKTCISQFTCIRERAFLWYVIQLKMFGFSDKPSIAPFTSQSDVHLAKEQNNMLIK